jgi:tryptophan synthase alpha chain
VTAGRIGQCFAELRARSEAALVTFLMAGDPDLDTTRALLRAVVDGGADLIELGVPFSDPTADGPVLQRSACRALQRGTSLARILEMVAETRAELPVPIVLFGYYNPIFCYGTERFANDAKAAGVDGVLVVDLPPEEADELWEPAQRAGLDMVFLLAPTSDDRRIDAVVRRASGFLYVVSMTGVTGSQDIRPTDVAPLVERIRAKSGLPIGVGFGISSGDQAAAVARFADAVIVGSAVMRIVEEAGRDGRLSERVGAFLRELKDAIRGARTGPR